jgi:Helix-turn-helix domain
MAINQSNSASETVWYTPKSLAAHLQVSVETVLGWIWSGQLEAVNVAAKPGGRPRWRIDPKAFERFSLIRQCPASANRASSNVRVRRPPSSVAGINRRLAKNIPHEVRVKRSALAMAAHRGGQGTEWRPFVPFAIARYEQKHGIRVNEADVVSLKAWWEDLETADEK